MKEINLFISWSGKKSGYIAHKISDWIPSFIGNIKTFHSYDDIKPGQIWITRLLEQIKDADMCIICLTKESMNSQWLSFEAGAIWNRLSSEAYPILIDLSSEDIKGPLGLIQSTVFDKKGMKKLIKHIGDKAGLDSSVVGERFKNNWSNFEEDVNIGLRTIPAYESKSEGEKSMIAVNEIIGYLNYHKFTTISFDKVRDKCNSTYTNEFLEGLINNYHSIFHKVKVRGGKVGIKKL